MSQEDYKADDATASELREADLLLEKADAFLQRHKHRRPPEPPSFEDDELPLLTDIVSKPDEAGRAGVELEGLEAELNRRIEKWFAAELPRLVERELCQFSRRLRHEALAHMRATLMPELAAEIAHHLRRQDTLKDDA